MSMGLMTAAALMPAKPVPSPAPMPAKNVTSTVKSSVISAHLLQELVEIAIDDCRPHRQTPAAVSSLMPESSRVGKLCLQRASAYR